MQYVIGLSLAVMLMGGGLLLLTFGLRWAAADEMTQRLREYVAQPALGQTPRAPLSIRRAELTGPLHTRMLLPWFRHLVGVFGRLTPARMIEDLGRQLTIAGNPLGLGPREFYGLRLAFTVLGFGLALLLLRGGVSPTRSIADGGGVPGAALAASPAASLNLVNVMGSVLAMVVSSYLPKTWLRRRVRSRQHAIRKALPDALDMLSVCADAGLGFDQSLQRISEHWKNPLAVELGRVVTEMGMGVPRAKALRNLADRMNVSELSGFVAVIVQSDQLGLSIAETLHAQAEQMRVERRFRAQEQARKLPLKMLFPLLLLIFPAMFAVILGPVLPVLGDLFTVLQSNTR